MKQTKRDMGEIRHLRLSPGKRTRSQMLRAVGVNIKDVPRRDTEDYPGIAVHDAICSGSITLKGSRLSVGTLTCRGIQEGWSDTAEDYRLDKESDGETLTGFLANLLEMRGDFGRLLCVLADVERLETQREETSGVAPPWYAHPASKRRVLAALKVCIANLENDLGPWGRGYVLYEMARKAK